jgi:glycosyltransferase involved in cell wall biosynthesis
MDLPRTLFIARETFSPGWYRCALPAMVLGCDWIGVHGTPPDMIPTTGRVGSDFSLADVPGYDVVVVQQASGHAWLRTIRSWQDAGVTVLYEIDDSLHGVRKARDHGSREKYDREAVLAHELCMRACDGVICSTEWLARSYRAVNPRTFVCRNGIDLRRYAFTRPQRESVGIGWAGGTGHTRAIEPWLAAVGDVMSRHPATRFTTIGAPFARVLEPEFGDRCLSVPFSAIEQYPAAMTHFDIALAPAGASNFFRGKSDLRWLEASAMAIPCIAEPRVYPEIEHGVTGFHASSPREVRDILETLVGDPGLRARVGEQAKAHVTEHRRIEVAAQSWAQVLAEVRDGVAPEPAGAALPT